MIDREKMRARLAEKKRERWAIDHGDCINVLKRFQPESFHSLVTDPPAGISFMGKDWDDDKGGRDEWIAWLTGVMRECLRVLKPGAHGLVWAIPRTAHWTMSALENAGFEIRDVVTHLFGTGFPKSLDVSKAIDKEAGAERQVVGKKKAGLGTGGLAPDGTFSRSTKSTEVDVTVPATVPATVWNGWGTALKPAAEFWVLVRKPIARDTVAQNVVEHGTGAINIDGCRVGTTDATKRSHQSEYGESGWRSGHEIIDLNAGRFPANLVMSHNPDCEPSPHVFPDGSTAPQCSDGCPVAMLDEQSGELTSGDHPRRRIASMGFQGSKGQTEIYVPPFSGDSGGASRFFYVAKPSKSERNAGCDDLPERAAPLMEERPSGDFGSRMDGRAERVMRNIHPTVKPIQLMRYFCRMVTPPDGRVLDPFAGSGTTGVAALNEGFKFQGIEQDAKFVEIGRARCANYFAESE